MTELFRYPANFVNPGTFVSACYDPESDRPFFHEIIEPTPEPGRAICELQKSLEESLASMVYHMIWTMQANPDLPPELKAIVDKIDAQRGIVLKLIKEE